MKNLGELLRRKREAASVSIESAAGLLKVNKNTLGGYERGERLPDIFFLTRFAAHMNEPLANLVVEMVKDARDAAQSDEEISSAEAFFLTSSSYRYSLPIRNELPQVNDTELHDYDVVRIAKYDCSGSCGPGNLVDNARVIDRIPVSREWLRREGLQPESTIIIGSKGDSMAPKIPPGSALMVDQTKRDPALGGVFAFIFQEELYIKNVQRTDTGLFVSSEQSAQNPPRIFREEEAASIQIEGRIHMVFSRA